MIRNVTSEEMKEIFKELKEQGWNPQWCNTPVPLFDSAEKVKKYLESGDAAPTDMCGCPRNRSRVVPRAHLPEKNRRTRHDPANLHLGDILRIC